MADPEKSRAQEPERRRDAAKAAPEDKDSFGAPPAFDEDDLRRAAIYLIEREAIELRRQRWVDLYYADSDPRGLESALRVSARRFYADDPLRKPRDQAPSFEREAAELDRLAKYDRPPRDRDKTAPSLMDRIGSWLKSIFIGG